MQKIVQKSNKIKRKLRIRSKVSGTAERPRLSVFRSNRYTTAQLINDQKGETIASVTKKELEVIYKKAKSKTDAAFEVGKIIAKKASDKKVKEAVFDRNGYLYHGRVKSLADGAREGGLKL